MKRRLVCILLSLCMIFSLLPVSAFALTQEEELYEQMLELGIVDEYGDLIEDNTFTVEGGTKLDSLDALVQWLNDSDESEHGLLITVDRTGRSATAAQMAQALALEYDMADVAAQINLLAAGDGASTQTTGTPSAGQEVKYIYNEWGTTANNDELHISFYPGNTLGSQAEAPCDITFEVGLFGDFMTADTDVSLSGYSVPGINEYKSFTFEKGTQEPVNLGIDLAAIRSALKTDGRLWQGSETVVLQWRVTGGMRQCTGSGTINISGSSENGSNEYYAQFLTDAKVRGFQNVDYYYDLMTDDVGTGVGKITEGTVDSTDVYKMTVPNIKGYIGSSDDVSIGWSDHKAMINSGMGNTHTSVKLTDVFLIFATENDLPTSPELYNEISGSLEKISKDGKVTVYNSGLSDAEMTEFGNQIVNMRVSSYESVLKADPLYTNASELITQMLEAKRTSLTAALTKGTVKLIRFHEIELPINTSADEKYSKVFCLKKGCLEDVEYTEAYIYCPGTLQLYDTTAPTVTSVSIPKGVTWYPGDKVPITVTFSEPVYSDYYLFYQDGTDTAFLKSCDGTAAADGTVQSTSGKYLSKTRTFLYTVQDTDSGSFQVKGVGAVSTSSTDAYGNALTTNAYATVNGTQYSYSDKCTLTATNIFGGGRMQDSISGMTAAADTSDPYYKVNVTVALKNDESFKQIWATWNTSTTKDSDAYIVLDGNTETKYPLTLAEDTTSRTISLNCAIDTSGLSAGQHVAELYLGGKLYYGAYATFTPETVNKVADTAYTIETPTTWPSGTANVVFKLDTETPTFTAVNGDIKTVDYTFESDDQFYWKSSNEKVFTVNVSNSDTGIPSVSVTAVGEGTAELQLWAKNGTDKTDKHTPAAKAVKITVVNGGAPGLVIPSNANTFFTRKGDSLKISFSANLTDANKSEKDETGGKITAKLYLGTNTSGKLVETYELERSAYSVTIPQNVLTTLSSGNNPAYTLVLTAYADVNGVLTPYETTANIVVRPQPTSITLSVDGGNQLVAGKSVTVNWTLTSYDPEGGDFELVVEKDGQEVKSTAEPGKSDGEGDYSGSLTFKTEQPTELKGYYIIRAKAKTASDTSYSTAAVTLTVYQKDSLDLLVNGKSVETVTLKNEVNSSVTTTDPTITNVDGEASGGLDTAEKIVRLRSELSLMQSIQIDCTNKQWSILTDMISWSTTTGEGKEIADEVSQAVTVNFRNGLLYEPLEDLPYTCYIPQAVMMLCGLRDGTNIVTATHSTVSDLSDSVTVSVERLKDKLYLFQFTPAAKTELSYTDSKGVSHTVYSNDDGSLALFEPDGIASDLHMASKKDNVDYRGTVSAQSLKSGEGNGTLGELYPLNAIELRRAATAEIQLLKPDGTALANATVTLRGGVYRNAILADERDDAYCEGAKFAKASGQSANLDGKKDQTFTTDENGVLTVHMDLTQFTSKNDPDDVGVGDSLQFIFELRFANNEYYPELVTVNGSLTERDAMRSGENQVTLKATDNGKQKPFVAVQTVDYYTGRQLDVRRHTGVVGPSSNYPEALLSTTLMLWGVDEKDANSYRIDLRSQNSRAYAPNQTVIRSEDATYPFSSIPLVGNETPLNSDTFVQYESNEKTPMEVVLTMSGKLKRTIDLPFGLVDMNSVEKVEDAPSLLSLMANLAAYGTVKGADENGKSVVDKISNGVLEDALTGITEMGAEAGLVRSVLLPTEDPTRFEGYFWTGLNTTKLEDLDYDENGIAVELSYFGKDWDCDNVLGQVNDTFTFSDFQAMADGSYFDDRSSLYAAASGAIGLPVMLQLEGWMSCEIRYNFDKGQWETLSTGGGFTAGAQLEFEKAYDLTMLPLTFSIKLRGGASVDFQTAVRYAQQLGEEWDDETASAVNDYLTALRINGYLEAFAGVGRDKGVTGKIGIFGTIEMNNEDRFLTRNYLKNSSKRGLEGQYLQLDGEIGIRAAAGVGLVATEVTVFSVSFNNNWYYGEWDDIEKYWESASSGLGTTGWQEGQPDSGENSVQSLSLDMAAAPTFVEVDRSVHLEDRDYLENADRTWNENAMFMLLGDEGNGSSLTSVLSNAYPYSTPQLSDDGSLWVYVHDADSTAVEDTEVRFGGGTISKYDSAIPDPVDNGVAFAGYGDSSLDFDGTSDFAGAVWLREAVTLKLPEGSELNENQQSLLLNGLEVVASIWDGTAEKWTTTRLTDNGSQEMLPVIAVNEKGQAIVAWRSVQSTDDNLFSYEQEQILYKIYSDGTWSDTYTLYNGASGGVSGLTAELLDNGTAAVAYTLADTDDVYYTVLDITANNPEANAKTIQAYEGSADSPALETVMIDGAAMFVLGWHSTDNQNGITSHDVGLLAFDENGAPNAGMPESLGQTVDMDNFGGMFTFAKGAATLDDLAIVWNETGSGESDNDVLRAVKFCSYTDGSYGLSAAMDAAELPDNTTVDHFDACGSYGRLTIAMEGTTYDPNDSKTVTYEFEIKTEDEKTVTCSGTGVEYAEESKLYRATATFSNSITVDSITVDFDTLATDAITPVSFTVTNSGKDVLTGLTLTIGNSGSQTINNLELRPGQTKVLSAVCKTGSTIENQSYTIDATFGTSGSYKAKGTVYLDYPDVGISTLQVTKEEEGIRTLLATLYNQSAAAVNKTNRRVVLGVYSDPECETNLDGKYFADGTSGQKYEIIIDEASALAALDGPGFSQEIEFKISQYIKDAKLDEIPDGGVTLFVKARIEEQKGGKWVTLPEADAINNQEYITLESLLDRSDDEPVTTTVQMENTGSTSSAVIQVRNNSLQTRPAGQLTVTLVDDYGQVLETKQADLSQLAGEGVDTEEFTFKSAGARVIARYGDTKTGEDADSNANAASITLEGLPLTLSSFDQDGKARVDNVKRGTYLLTVIPAASDAAVTVDGKLAENGVVSVAAGYSTRTLSIVITALDGQTTRTYEVTLLAAPSGGGSTTYTIKATAGANGSISPSGNVSIREGNDQTFTITPDAGYVVSDVKVDSKSVGAVSSYIFKDVKAGHTIEATFAKAGTGVFVDVPAGSYYEAAVNWAVENGITTGTDATHFTPDGICTRAQAVTFLWRAARSPEPKAMTMPFTDVAAESYYYKAVLWAIENGITNGTSDTTFSPDVNCSRAQIVTFLWRSENSPAVVSNNPFTDVSSDAYYSDAVLWAVKEDITKGTSDTTFSPNANCTRAQIVTFLWRAMN